jgi:protein required for attachment to host cells
MDNLKIPRDGMIFVGDGRKALFLRNHGDAISPNLKVERVLTQDNPPTREQGSDRPGRAFKRAGTNLRSGMATTDWHDLEEHRFAREVADALEEVVRAKGAKSLIVVAPARTLADLRRAFHDDVKKKIIAEIDKDLTKHPVGEIEKHILG